MFWGVIESYVPVRGYEGHYEVSDLGNVRSLDRFVTTKYGPARRWGRVLKPGISSNRYMTVVLSKDGNTTSHCIHVLVARAFLPEPNVGEEVRHLDGNKLDCRVQNLEWGTRRQNALDTVRHGHHSQAKKTHCKRGHPYDAGNTYVIQKSRGHVERRCKRCQKDWPSTLRRQKQVT